MHPAETIHVSAHFHHLQLELQKRVSEVVAAESQEQVNDLWPGLCAAREALYRYVEGLEEHANVERQTILRF